MSHSSLGFCSVFWWNVYVDLELLQVFRTALFSLMSPYQSADKPSQLSEIQLRQSLGPYGKFVMLGMWGHVQYGLQVYFQKQKCISVASVLLNIDFLSAVLEVRNPPGKNQLMGICMVFLWLEHNFFSFVGIFFFKLGQRCFEASFHTRQEHHFDKAQGLVLGSFQERLIKQSTLVTEGPSCILNNAWVFVVAFQKMPWPCRLTDGFFLTLCAMPAPARSTEPSVSKQPEIRGQRWVVKSQRAWAQSLLKIFTREEYARAKSDGPWKTGDNTQMDVQPRSRYVYLCICKHSGNTRAVYNCCMWHSLDPFASEEHCRMLLGEICTCPSIVWADC